MSISYPNKGVPEPRLLPRPCRGPGLYAALLLMMILGSAPVVADGQEPSAPTPAAIVEELRHFQQMGRVLHLAAHPDDENTQLITWLSRGRGYATAYLSITRGDGGQNELGAVFDEKLGVVRTQELLAARRLDGGRQFFTRAIDFGFSKNPEETLRIWDHQQVLADVVRVYRTFRPDVVITRFPVPPGSGGHGHHTASAILAVEAFKVSGDPQAFPEQIAEGLKPWQPRRVVWNGFGGGRGGGGPKVGGTSVQVDIGGADPVTGEGFGAIAGRSRAMHKTQGFGNFGGGNGGGAGPNPQTFVLLAGEEARTDFMDGVDTTWARVPGDAEIGRLIHDTIEHFDTNQPAASVPALLALRSRVDALAPTPLMEEKRSQLDMVIKDCLGIGVRTTIGEPEVAPGETVKLHHEVTLRAAMPVRWVSMRFPRSKDEVAVAIKLPASSPAQSTSRETTRLIPADTAPSQPYWLRQEGTGGIYHVGETALIGRPENPPVLPVEYVFEVSGQTLVVPDEPVFSAGTGRARPLAVVAPVALRFDADVALLPPGSSRPVQVEVRAARGPVKGSLSLQVPPSWSVTPASQPFEVMQAGGKTGVRFTVTAPAQPAAGSVFATAEVGGRKFTQQRLDISYDHLPLQILQPPARLRVASLECQTRGRAVGYLPGAGDDIAAALEALGYKITILSGPDLTPEKLKGLDAVVVGVRAFNERKDLAANIAGLFAYAENGGTVIVQYNRPTGLQTKRLGPYDLSIEGNPPQWRVTDETVPVTFLAPTHAVLTTPNPIGPADFDGWVQERGSYYPSSYDPEHYTPILSMSDPGEAPLKSGLLVARHGQGWFVYTGLTFFRQLPAGVPGAYRLFANLVSLGK